MSKRKLAALFIMSSGCLMALGLNCIPNLGRILDGTAFFGGIFGPGGLFGG